MRKLKITINPFFIMEGLTFYLLRGFEIWFLLMFCSFLQEGGQAYFSKYYILSDEPMVNEKLCIHFTPLGIRVESNFFEFNDKIFLHFIGTFIGLLVAITFLAFEFKLGAITAFTMAILRILPILPFEGGKITINFLSKHLGTLRISTCLIKIGVGIGYGFIIFGVTIILYTLLLLITSNFFVVTSEILKVTNFFILIGALFSIIGGYLVYVNKKSLYPITKRLFQGLASKGSKPIKGIKVNGTETPIELSFYINPFEEIFFFPKNKNSKCKGVSQQKVIAGILDNQGADWLWDYRKKNKI